MNKFPRIRANLNHILAVPFGDSAVYPFFRYNNPLSLPWCGAVDGWECPSFIAEPPPSISRSQNRKAKANL